MTEKYKRQTISQDGLKGWLAGYPKFMSPIADFIEAMGFDDMYIENESILVIGNEPEIAPFAYAIILFPALDKKQIHTYMRQHCPTCPPQFITMLENVNGAELDALRICGIPPSMLGDVPLLSRQIRNPLSISTFAQHSWKQYPGATAADFMFAARNTGWKQQLGYFFKPDSSIVAYPNVEGPYQIRKWESFEAWLLEELPETLRHRSAYREEVARESKKRNKNIAYTLRRVSFFFRRIFTRF